MAIDGDSPTWEVTDASGERPTVKGTAKECNGRYRGSHPTPEIVFQNGNRMEFNSPTFHHSFTVVRSNGQRRLVNSIVAIRS